MPTARCTFSAGVINERIYAVGGAKGRTDAQRSVPLQIVEEYQPATDTWTRKADMPTARNALSVSVVNETLFAIGGAGGIGIPLQTVEEYQPNTDTWMRKADMPTPRYGLSTCAVNGRIYAIGGSKGGFNALSTVEEYDPVTDMWTQKADMPTARIHLSTSVVDGKIYAIGGATGAPSLTSLTTVEEYDPITDIWTRKANLPSSGCTLSTSVVNGKIYAIGGATQMMSPISTVQVYNPATDTWTQKADMPTARSGLSTGAANGKIYAIGGLANTTDMVLSTVEEYDTGFSAPLPDFNGDGFVNITDLLRLIESWGTDDPIVDIAPPLGDGFVDVLDLELLMSYWEQPIDDPTLVAHWALDETEGDIAYDSAGVNDAVVIGGSEWQPDGGHADGAFQLDGIDDYAVADPALNPADGPFSVFVWIKGGAPGQVILSQANGANWLGADSDFGCIMTELIPPAVGRFVPQPLKSESVITDGQWHRIGFVWDGASRALYVDDILVIEDTQTNLQGSDAGLYIGTGKDMEPGTYFSGLIDDIRIYNRAVRP
jgi:N-acetylneuraminic acid mutarotase